MRTLPIAILCLLPFLLSAQEHVLKPGFSIGEYVELLKISARTGTGPAYYDTIDAPETHRELYTSQPMGLDHLWSLWINEIGKVGVISLRGTTQNSESWLANFYAAMVPAQGEITWKDGGTFTYNLSDNPLATVHAGWLLGMAFLSREIVPYIDSLHQRGVRDFLIIGHSQGGGLAYLLNAHLQSLVRSGELPSDLLFKTYSSAGPKPGNLFFAYSYEAMTQNGWAFNVVNAYDWVPEMPFSIQTFDDFNPTNPFVHADDMIKAQKFPQNIVLRMIYNKLDRPTRKAQKRYSKYLGAHVSKMVGKQIEELVVPDYASTFNYVRTGITIVMTPDEAYDRKFPKASEMTFGHHLHPNYIFLAEHLNPPFYQE